MTGARTHARSTPRRAAVRTVSRPHDAHEREADRAADVVGRGGSVAGWSFSSVPVSAPAPVQRQEVAKEKTDEEKRNEALKKTGEAVLATPQGQALKAKVLADPLVKSVTDAVTSTPGKIVTGAAVAGGVAALAATGKELPVQPPEIPLDRITPGLSAKVTYQGPVNAPTFVGLTVTYKEQGPKGKRAARSDAIAADITRLKAEQEMFRPASEKAAARQQEAESVAAWVASQQLPGLRPGFTIPLTPAPGPKKEEAPVQRAPASTSPAPAHAQVDDAIASGGRPLEAATRRSMEARFGYDFSGVRIHDDARAGAAAARMDAAAFTVDQDTVFGPGRFDPQGQTGRRLLAHELAHVVQQGVRGAKLQGKVEPAISAPSDPATSRPGDPPQATPLHPAPEGQIHADPLSRTSAARSQLVDRVSHHKGSGVRLASPLQARFGEYLGEDVSAVRIHTDAFASSTSRLLGANAFTLGRDIFFGAGMFAPDQPDGFLRVAHELAHTIQQRGSSAPPAERVAALEAEADAAIASGAGAVRSRVGPTILLEPTYPRRSTGDRMIREAERIMTTTRNPAAIDATTRLWSRVRSNFEGSITAGTIARRIWTHVFLRHFTEPDARPGVESPHPRYLHSSSYGWIDGQHLFGFIDFAEQQEQRKPGDRQAAFEAATEQGVEIEANQQSVRDRVILGAPPATGPTRIMQVRPPNTPLFRSPQMVAGAAALFGAKLYALIKLRGTQRELFGLLNEQQTQKFFLDSAKSAWSYEDIVSNQLGIRFFYEHGARINALTPSAREPAFLDALSTFFGSIGVENSQARLDRLARSLPGRERWDRPTTTEARERRSHPELFNLPATP